MSINLLNKLNLNEYTPDVQDNPWKMMVGRLLSYWEGIFWGAMLNFQGVTEMNKVSMINIWVMHEASVEYII